MAEGDRGAGGQGRAGDRFRRYWIPPCARRLASTALAGLAVIAVAAVEPTAAQVRVSLSGQVESNLGLDSRRVEGDTTERLAWGSRYSPNLDGFVWHPRFVRYSLSGIFSDQTIDAVGGRTELLHREPYRLQLNVFPGAPHSFILRAARTTFESQSSPERGPEASVSTTTETQGFAWTYRGSATLPSTTLDFARMTTTTESTGEPLGQTLTSIGLETMKSFARANPRLRYRLDMRDDSRPADRQHEVSGAEREVSRGEEIGHTIEYSDRIRIGERVTVSPTATYQINPVTEGGRSATTVAVPFAGPINPTLDGSADLRYSLAQGEALTHTFAADGALTRRFSADHALSGGVSGVLIRGQESDTWSAGGFANLNANPYSHLRSVTSYGLTFNGADAGLGVTHRGQLGATSTLVPRHTLSGNYFLNVVEPARGGATFWSHGWQLAANSALVPLTVLDASYGLELHEGAGHQIGHSASLGIAVNPPIPLVLRASGDFSTRATSGGGREPAEETAYGLQAGVDTSPFYWLVLSLTARRGVSEVIREDRVGEFISERVNGAVTVTWRKLQGRTEAFLEREPVEARTGRGVRAQLAWQFRIWTITLELERALHTSVRNDVTQDRLFLRIVRPLSHLLAWP